MTQPTEADIRAALSAAGIPEDAVDFYNDDTPSTNIDFRNASHERFSAELRKYGRHPRRDTWTR